MCFNINMNINNTKFKDKTIFQARTRFTLCPLYIKIKIDKN